MTYLTVPFLTYVFAVLPVWLPLLVVDLTAMYMLLFRERFDPRTFVFWVAIVFIIPFGGFLLYLVFGCSLFMEADGRRKHGSDQEFLTGDGDPVPEGDSRLSSILSDSGADVYTSGNDVRLFWSIERSTGIILEQMRSATESIHLEMDRISSFRFTGSIQEVLCEKARQGLDVRVITSTLGFGRTKGLRCMKAAGVHHTTLHTRLHAMFSFKTVNRCLRAVLVVDGKRAFTGIGAGVEMVGRAATRLDRRFLADWAYATGERIAVPADASPCTGGCGVQMVSSGPDSPGLPMIHGYSEIISGARERLYVTFPYLIPADDMYNAIKQAAISGTDVRILIPTKCRHWYQAWNSLAASIPLIDAGARVFFAPKALVKCLVVADGRVCTVGSCVFNTHSPRMDYGENAIVFSEDVAMAAEREFLSELDGATECRSDDYRTRSFSDKLRITVARMFMFLN